MRSRLSLIAVFTVLGVALLLAVWMLADARQTAWDRAAETSTNLAQALGHDIEHTVENCDLALQRARDGLRLPGIVTRYLGTVAITDAAGNVVASASEHFSPGLNVSDRDYFQAQKASADNQLFIGKPFRGRLTGEDSIGLSRKLLDDKGRFTGVVVGTIRLAYFSDLLDQVRTARGDVAQVLFTDGTLLTRNPPLSQPAPADRELLVLMDSATGAFEHVEKNDSIRRLYSYHRVGTLPLVVVVGETLESVYAEWWQRALVVALVGLPLLAAALLLGWALSQELERRSQAEQDASERGAEFRTTFDHSADGLFLLRVLPSGGFKLERANAALTRLWGLPVGTMEGREPRSFLSSSLLSHMEPHWTLCVETGDAVRYPQILDHGNRRLELETVMTPVRDETDHVTMLLGSTRDVSERSDMARRLAQAQKLEAVGHISAGVTHDFNNLLQTLTIGMREMMAQLPDTDMRRRLRSTLQAVERGVELTRRLLSFSRHTTEAIQPIDPGQVIIGCTELLTWTLGARITLQAVTGSTLWPINADRAQLEMCLLNLTANARDAMPQGGKLLVRARNASARESAQAGLPATDSVVISVQDNGSGMDTATRSRVFEAFFSTKQTNRGSGLGLWMVRSFAREAGGDVRIESESGKGTEVSIWLPRSAESPARSQSTMLSPRSSSWHAATTNKAERGRILLVDDDDLVRQALARLLLEAKHEVVALGDGESALHFISSTEHFDLLIADQSIPGLTGTELVAQTAHLRPGLPVMLITGFARLEEIPPHVRVLHKPIDADLLLAEVIALIQPITETIGA